MFGSGLHFNSPGIVRVQKTFGVATNPSFDWTLIGPAYNAQNVIIELPITGPSLIPFMAIVYNPAGNIAIDAATLFYINYYGDGVLANASLFSIPLLNAIDIESFGSYPLEKSNFNAGASTWPNSSNRLTNAGICIAADQPLASGTSLIVTLYCVRSGLNY